MTIEQTDNYSLYLDYLDLKKECSVIYKGVDLIKACSVDFVDVIACSSQKNIREIGTCFFKKLQVDPLVESFINSDVVFSFNFPKRKDHYELARCINASVEGSVLIELKYVYSFCFRFSFFRYFRFIFQNLPDVSLKNKIYLAAKMSSYRALVDSLNEKFGMADLSSKKYIGFLSSAYTECLLTLFFNTKGVKTHHVFHGIFGKYIKSISNDIVNAENIVANQALAFSKSQYEFIVNMGSIPKNRVLVAGNPKYPFKKIEVSNSMIKCAVLGGIRYYDNSLEELLTLLNEVSIEQNINFTLKPHPLSDILNSPTIKKCKQINLISNNKTIHDLFQSGVYDFAIVHNTTAYYECMYYGVIPLRWGRDENLDLNGFDDKFYDKESLMKLLNKYRNMDPEYISRKFEEILVDEIGMGINNYNSIINGD